MGWNIDITEKDYDNIVELYLSGNTLQEIGNMYNTSRVPITRILKEKGITIRGRSEAHRIYNINEHYFDDIDNHDKAYCVGLIYADGCNNTDENCISIELQEEDSYILEKINALLESDRPLCYSDRRKTRPNTKPTYQLNVHNEHMSQRLNELGVVQRKSLVLEFPNWLKKELIPTFILGYFDGDGTVSKQAAKIEMVGTWMFLQGIQQWCYDELGIEAKIRNTQNKESVTKNLYITGRKKVECFMDCLYSNANFFLRRKYDLYQYMIKNINNISTNVAS